MTVYADSNNSLIVGDLLVEPALNKISRNLSAINLRPQLMELLVFLATNQGQVISIDELLDNLWPGKVVTEGSLYNCIGELRHAISDLDDTRAYIENIPKRGYRLSVAVENLREPPTTPAADDCGIPRAPSGAEPHGRSVPARSLQLLEFLGIRRSRAGDKEGSLAVSSKVGLVLVGGLIVAVVTSYYLAGPADNSSIAVLPFEDISPGGNQAYFGNGIADELRLELQRLDGLRVAGRTSSIASAREDFKTIGEVLNVDSIIEGSIRKEGSRVRIAVQLTNVADGFTIWSESYNRELENIFEIQEEIATAVAGALGVRLGVGGVNAFRGAGTRNVAAYEAYLQGHNRNLTNPERLRLLERATELDPNYAAAWSLLGGWTLHKLWFVSPDQISEIRDRAYSFALRGVQLNPESAVAQTTLALIRHNQFDWIGAEQSSTRAIELLADRDTVSLYAYVLIRNGRTAYAQKQFGIAKALEPLGGRPVGQSWHADVAQGRFAEAKEISNWQDAVNRIENNLDIAFNERDPEALKAAIQAMPKTPITNVAYSALHAQVLAEFDSPERILSMLRVVYLDENLQWPRKLHDIAMLAAYFGDPQFALKVKGEEVRIIPTRLAAVWYPIMSELRQLPEFKTLVTELNLVEYWRAYGWADACRPLGEDDFTCT